MRITALATAAVATAVAAATLGLGNAASAATASHYATARADWKHGATVAAADEGRFWKAARRQLGGARFTHERFDLATLAAIPLTGTTPKQRATAKRVTRELNGFFRTPGLYGVSAGQPRKIARADWIKSAHVAAAEQKLWFGAANDELASFGSRYHHERAALTSLESIPLTGTTAQQRATARRDVRVLDKFFGTPGLNH
jgi:hypothetical protein